MTLNYKSIINYIAKIGQILLKKHKEWPIIDRFWILKNIWNIIQSEAGWKVKNEDMHLLNIDGHITNKCQVTSDAFSNFFCQLLKEFSTELWKSLLSGAFCSVQLRPKYPLKHPILEHPQPTFIPLVHLMLVNALILKCTNRDALDYLFSPTPIVLCLVSKYSH